MIKIIGSIFLWIVYIITGISIAGVIILLFRILVWDRIKKFFIKEPKKKQDKEILEGYQQYNTFSDIGKKKNAQIQN